MGDSTVKVSFLVTYYNQRNFVKDSIDSILKIEKNSDWEIIVGDDGSSDGTLELVEDYISCYPDNIRLFVMPREEGVNHNAIRRASANRLNILEKAEGDYFCILDGDDYYVDDSFVNEAVQILDDNEKVSVVLFGYRCDVGKVQGKLIVLPGKEPSGFFDKREYISSHYIHAGAGVYRRKKMLEKMKVIRETGIFDDNDIVFSAISVGELYTVRRSVYGYRQTESSVFNSMKELEKDILNIWGYDIDRRYLGSEYHQELLQRLSPDLIRAYIWRNNLRKTLGEKKYLHYYDEAKRISDSLCYRFLTYGESSEAEKKALRLIVRERKKQNKVLMIKIYIRYLFRGIFK